MKDIIYKKFFYRDRFSNNNRNSKEDGKNFEIITVFLDQEKYRFLIIIINLYMFPDIPVIPDLDEIIEDTSALDISNAPS